MKHKSIKRRSTKRRHTKRRLTKRRLTKRRHTKKYRIHGGAGELPEPKYTEVPPPLPGNTSGVPEKIAEQNANQNQANKTLTGGKRSRGKRSRGKRSRGKRSRGKRSRGKRSRGKRILKHSGGAATICGGSPINGPDGYGYVSPNNCLLVPTVNNPTAQALAIDAMNNLNVGASNAAGDRLVGKIV
jgi:hypothetical protein